MYNTPGKNCVLLVQKTWKLPLDWVDWSDGMDSPTASLWIFSRFWDSEHRIQKSTPRDIGTLFLLWPEVNGKHWPRPPKTWHLGKVDLMACFLTSFRFTLETEFWMIWPVVKLRKKHQSVSKLGWKSFVSRIFHLSYDVGVVKLHVHFFCSFSNSTNGFLASNHSKFPFPEWNEMTLRSRPSNRLCLNAMFFGGVATVSRWPLVKVWNFFQYLVV